MVVARGLGDLHRAEDGFGNACHLARQLIAQIGTLLGNRRNAAPNWCRNIKHAPDGRLCRWADGAHLGDNVIEEVNGLLCPSFDATLSHQRLTGEADATLLEHAGVLAAISNHRGHSSGVVARFSKNLARKVRCADTFLRQFLASRSCQTRLNRVRQNVATGVDQPRHARVDQLAARGCRNLLPRLSDGVYLVGGLGHLVSCPTAKRDEPSWVGEDVASDVKRQSWCPMGGPTLRANCILNKLRWAGQVTWLAYVRDNITWQHCVYSPANNVNSRAGCRPEPASEQVLHGLTNEVEPVHGFAKRGAIPAREGIIVAGVGLHLLAGQLAKAPDGCATSGGPKNSLGKKRECQEW